VAAATEGACRPFPRGMNAVFAPGSTVLLAIKLGSTGSQLAFGKRRLKPFLAIWRLKLQSSYADWHSSFASIRRNVSSSIFGACASACRRSRRRARACAYLRRYKESSAFDCFWRFTSHGKRPPGSEQNQGLFGLLALSVKSRKIWP